MIALSVEGSQFPFVEGGFKVEETSKICDCMAEKDIKGSLW